MRIGINGKFLVTKRTGVQRVAYNLISEVLRVDNENEYFIFTGHQFKPHAQWVSDRVHIVASSINDGVSFRNLWWEQFLLPRLAKKYKIDVLHSPANISPILYRGRTVVHIHDLCFIVNPGWYSFGFRTWYNFLIPRLLQRADIVTTNSNNSRNDLIQYCGVEPKKLRTLSWAVDRDFLPAGGNEIREKENFEKEHQDYILYVGSLQPRKNIKQLVMAFARFRHLHPKSRTKLILIGGESPLFPEVKLNSLEFGDDILFKGFVSDSELRCFYRSARLFVYPSFYEGFGLPPLEAMAMGTPVITSDSSSLPEVVGDAACKVSPHSVTKLAQAITEVLGDRALQRRLVRKGYRRIMKFNWVKVAKRTQLIYQEAYTGKKVDKDSWARITKQPDPDGREAVCASNVGPTL